MIAIHNSIQPRAICELRLRCAIDEVPQCKVKVSAELLLGGLIRTVTSFRSKKKTFSFCCAVLTLYCFSGFTLYSSIMILIGAIDARKDDQCDCAIRRGTSWICGTGQNIRSGRYTGTSVTNVMIYPIGSYTPSGFSFCKSGKFVPHGVFGNFQTKTGN